MILLKLKVIFKKMLQLINLKYQLLNNLLPKRSQLKLNMLNLNRIIYQAKDSTDES